jgi:putative transposase
MRSLELPETSVLSPILIKIRTLAKIQGRQLVCRRPGCGETSSPPTENLMKKIRLDKNAYLQQGYPCHITICSQQNQQIFVKGKFTCACMELLESLCQEYSIRPFVYCFMPDHIHMIVAVEGNISIIAFVQTFKSKATIESYKHDFEGKIFQSRFYDRFIRSDQNLQNEIRYVLENPVRAGIVVDYRDYPYSKCFYDIDDDP